VVVDRHDALHSLTPLRALHGLMKIERHPHRSKAQTASWMAKWKSDLLSDRAPFRTRILLRQQSIDRCPVWRALNSKQSVDRARSWEMTQAALVSPPQHGVGTTISGRVRRPADARGTRGPPNEAYTETWIDPIATAHRIRGG